MVSLSNEKVWTDKKIYDEAERSYYETLAKRHYQGTGNHGEGMRTNLLSTPNIASKGNNASNNITTHSKKSRKEKDKSNTNIKASEKQMCSTNTQHAPIIDSNKKANEDCVKSEGVASKQAKNYDNLQKKLKSEKVTERTADNTKFKTEGNVAPLIASQSSLASEVAKARQHIKNSLECMDSVAALAGVPNVELLNKVNKLEKENSDLNKIVQGLRSLVLGLQSRVETLESNSGTTQSAKIKASVVASTPAVAVPAAGGAADSDDGVDLFGSDDEEESAEATRLREERLATYNAKKAKKPVLIAKSNIILDVKPWDDETDMAAMEAAVRSLATDGLLWGAAKLVPLAYGIRKLQISCVVEDDKVSVDWLTEEIEKFENFVQSVDIAAFNKV